MSAGGTEATSASRRDECALAREQGKVMAEGARRRRLPFRVATEERRHVARSHHAGQEALEAKARLGGGSSGRNVACAGCGEMEERWRWRRHDWAQDQGRDGQHSPAPSRWSRRRCRRLPSLACLQPRLPARLAHGHHCRSFPDARGMAVDLLRLTRRHPHPPTREEIMREKEREEER